MFMNYEWVITYTYLFRFCDAMIQIRREAEDIVTVKQPRDNNLLKNAPHPLSVIVLPESEWNRLVL
jgi:glycine dehydrogenase